MECLKTLSAAHLNTNLAVYNFFKFCKSSDDFSACCTWFAREVAIGVKLKHQPAADTSDLHCFFGIMF